MHGSEELGGKERRQGGHLGNAQDWAILAVTLSLAVGVVAREQKH